MEFTTRDGEKLFGTLIRQYSAFEGGIRYILSTRDGKEYRCIKDTEGNLIEYVV